MSVFLNLMKRSSNYNAYVNLSTRNKSKHYSSNILGIETSCDDTGCAIINDKGDVLSEVLHTQNLIHLRYGGIIPDVAQDLHKTHIQPTVSNTLEKARLTMEDITAIAVTLKPGLPLSLAVGMKYAKHLARKHRKPIIPIHHMEAHALVARLEHDISFPFLALLISGGHCLLSIVHDVNKFQLLGESIDIAPGEMFDKIARRMKLRNVPEYSTYCGGQAVELAASKATNKHNFQLPLPLSEYRDCNFSFNGLKTSILLQLHRKEKYHKIVADEIIPEINDLCRAALLATSRHLVHRTQRAMEFCEQKNIFLGRNKYLVVSGGVACNNFIFNALKLLCNETEYKVYRPSANLCTDNGIMIAWNGLEKWRKCIDITTNLHKLDIEATCQLGDNLIEEVRKANILTKLIKLKL